ncbi:MAG: Dyp-type peroxidase [Alphaproteobacteria bacterium]|nr:Dyp-type peroxidase [Alphaproteobacteria bacterium]
MSTPQPGILADVPPLSRYLEFTRIRDTDPRPALTALAAGPVDESVVIGLGAGLVMGLGGAVQGLRHFPALTGPGVEVPSTQADLWVWVRGTDRGVITHRGRAVEALLKDAFARVRLVDGFKYDISRDLSGFEDGTENPKGDKAAEAAIATGRGAGLDGSSFVAAQQWAHNLTHMESLSQKERDDIVGRHQDTNEEFDEAPDSAHVKRTAQESFEPVAFVVRRSMPWADASGEGLMFVAFGHSFDAYEAQMRRMTGLEDGIVDGLFRYSRPISGSFFWCPPVLDGHLDLSAMGV